MTTYNHTAIVNGASNDASTFNSPLGQLDAAIGNLGTRSSVREWINNLVLANGAVVATVQSNASISSSSVSVTTAAGQADSFEVGSRVWYTEDTAGLEVGTVTAASGTTLTFSTQSASGQVSASTLVGQLSELEYDAISNGIYNDTTLTLAESIAMASEYIVHVDAYDSIQDAMDAAYALVDTESTPAQGTIPRVVFTPGRTYAPTATIDIPDYAIIEGNNAIIKPATDTFDVFDTDNAQDVTIRDLQFRDGQTAIAYDPVSPNMKRLKLVNCTFMDQTTGGIVEKATVLNGLQIVIEQCTFRNSNTGANLMSLAADMVTIQGCWLQASCDTWIVNSSSLLLIDGCITVPETTGTQLVDNQDPSSLIITNCRLGQENGGMEIFENNASLDTDAGGARPMIIIRNNRLGSGTSAGRIGTFNALPNVFIFEGNGQLGNNLGFEFTSSIPADDIASMGQEETLWVVRDNASDVWTLEGTAAAQHYMAVRAMLADKSLNAYGRADLTPSDVVRNYDYADTGWTASSSNTSAAGQTNVFGSPGVTITATADSASRKYYHNTALNGLAAGVYTLVAEVEIVGVYAQTCQLEAASNTTSTSNGYSRRFQLTTGTHVISMPFYFNGSANHEMLSVGVFDMPDTSQYRLGGIRVFAGHVNVGTVNTIVYSTAAPSSGTWRLGDICYNTSIATTGKPLGWICVDDDPVTWSPFGKVDGVADLPDNNTPSVLNGSVFVVSSSAGRDITTFDDGYNGQRITLILANGNTDFTHGSGLVLAGAVDWDTGATGDTIEFVYCGNDTTWYEVSRSDNS